MSGAPAIPRNGAPWLLVALGEFGISEVDGPEHNARILQYHDHTTLDATADEVPWCSSFANACMVWAGIAGTRSARARSWETWGRECELVPGAVAVFARGKPWQGHVAFVLAANASRVWVIGGNQSNAVTITSYPRSGLVTCRWPDAVPGAVGP